MDAHHWHQQTTAAPRANVSALTEGQLRRATPEERQEYASAVRRFLRVTPLKSPKHECLAAALDEALAQIEDEPPGARTILSLSAPFGVGKSSLIKDWAQRLYRDWLGDRHGLDLPEWSPVAGVSADWVPVVYVTLMARSNARALYSALLAYLGYPTQGVSRDVALWTTRALGTHGVRVVIVDDAHMLTTEKATGRATLDALKQVNTELGELGGTLVLVGANLTGGAALTDPQIRARLLEHTLEAYDLRSRAGVGQWQELLAGAESRIRPFLPNLSEGTLPSTFGASIYKRTQGYVGDTHSLIAGATAQALLNGRTDLEREDWTAVRLSQRAQDGEALLGTSGAPPRERFAQ